MKFLLLIAAILPQPIGVIHDRADVLEINTVVCQETGQVTIEQLVAFEHDESVIGWKLRGAVTIHRDFDRGDYSATWIEGDRLFVVRAPSFRRVLSDYDRECVRRSEKRRGWAK